MQTHTPLVQAEPGGQTWPHAPQLVLLLLRLTHVPLQLVKPDRQPLQVPLLQATPGGHWFPHVPQLWGLVFRLTQVPLQLVVPVGHTHVPLLQTAPLQQRGVVEAHGCPGPLLQVDAKAFSRPREERTPPKALASMPLSTCRREGLRARNFVNSSKREEFMLYSLLGCRTRGTRCGPRAPVLMVSLHPRL